MQRGKKTNYFQSFQIHPPTTRENVWNAEN